MSEPRFTPGPWSWDFPEREEHNVIVWKDANTRICFMSHDGSRHNTFGKANAALIAAAPDLYAALEKCVEHLRCVRNGYSTISPEEQARAALAKARGEA